MAARKNKGNYPVQRCIPLGRSTTQNPASTNAVVHVPWILSQVNRRLYRQHGMYRVNIQLEQSPTATSYDVYALANTWWVRNALKAAHKAYYTAMSDELEQTKPARWHDFIIDDGLTSTDHLHAMLYDGSASVAVEGGEWSPSLIELPSSAQASFRLSGATTGTYYNVFTEYDAMQNAPASPATPATGGYDGLLETFDAENVQLLQEQGNLPPYDPDNLPDVWVHVGKIYSNNAGGAQRLSTGWFDAPLGVVYIPGLNSLGNSGLCIDIAAGSYKGVLCDAL
jgi:hypothetical protein